ncbi:hypothetical protein M426DRAFT_27197 [Hypoxylon sp. CI-4A]|nr:hypothetical protein M426DRAFT_27197 [Hypoxylon sp. CI-4A]
MYLEIHPHYNFNRDLTDPSSQLLSSHQQHMNRTRQARSKTGCSSCRRRKVRCDEGKPVCNACTRLGLNCSYEPSRSANSGETLRYRVRFVNSRHSKLPLDATTDKQSPTSSSSTSQLEAISEIEQNPKVSKDNVELPSGGQQREVSSDMSQQRPVQPSTGASIQHNTALSAIPEQGTLYPNSQLDTRAYDAQTNPDYLPVFFDLNSNFDLLSESWMSPLTPGNTSLSESESYQVDIPEFSMSTQGSNVIIPPEDNRLIQHFLNVMTNYAKIRGSGDENIYSYIFSNMALFYKPLYDATMAWTALHLGQTRADFDLVRKAEERHARAVSLMHRDKNNESYFEHLIITTWFALQFEIIAARGIESFCQQLEFVADLVEYRCSHRKAGGEVTPLGHIASRMLVWLGTYDARAACVGGEGRLLQTLEAFNSEYDFIGAAYPNLPSNTEDLKPCLRVSLELDYLESCIVRLSRGSIVTQIARWSTVQSGLVAIRERLEADSYVAPIIGSMNNPTRLVSGKITTARFNCLLLLANLYSVVISFHRRLPSSIASSMPNKLISAEAAANYIIRLSALVCRSRPPSPQNIWPRLLFIAGIETTDLPYQDWVVKTLSDAEIWGVNYRKTRELLERVIEIQSTEGVRVDYVDVMKRDTGLFII